MKHENTPLNDAQTARLAALAQAAQVMGVPLAYLVRLAADQTDAFFTRKEVAVKLKVTPRTIDNWQRDGILPVIKIATVVLFYWPMVVNHLIAHFTVFNGPVAKTPSLGTVETLRPNSTLTKL